eukprot:3082227-Prymnesium_polylepis.1
MKKLPARSGAPLIPAAVGVGGCGDSSPREHRPDAFADGRRARRRILVLVARGAEAVVVVD